MATTKKKAPAKAAAKPNMFAKAKTGAAEKPAKKQKGTVFTLPKNLDEDGSLVGPSKDQNEAITTVITAKQEEAKAKNKGNLAKGILNSWTTTRYCEHFASLGVMPPTPVSVSNHLGETLTFVMQDKTQQNTLDEDQIVVIEALLGSDATAMIVETIDKYGFDPKVMAQPAGEVPAGASAEKVAKMQTVQDIVFEVVSGVLANHPKLTDEQRENLVTSESVTRLKAGTLSRLAEFAGADATKIEQLLEAIGSGAPHYLKT